MRVVREVEGESATDDSFGNDTDVNNIVERFTRTGILPPATKEAQYADVSGLQKDLTELINEANEAKARVEELAQEQQRAKRENEENETNELRERVKELEAAQSTEPAPNSP